MSNEEIKKLFKIIKTLGKKFLVFVLPENFFKKLMLIRQRRGAQKFVPKVVSHKYGRHIFKVNITDPLAQNWYDKDWDELPEIVEMRKYSLKPGAHVFNLGAHQCVVAMLLAQEVGPSGQVVALEANPHNAEIAQKNRDLNQVSQLIIYHEAVGEINGELNFNDDLNGQVDSNGKLGNIKVKSRTIDSLIEEFGSPNLITIDVEGFECSALRGAKRTATEIRPDFWIEVHVKTGLENLGGSVKQLIDLLPCDKYRHLITVPESGKFEEIDFSKEESFQHPIVKNRFHMLVLARR